MIKNFSFLFVCLFLIQSLHSSAQTCEYFPADCPTDNIEGTRDSMTCINNLIIPQEIAKQHFLRNYTTDIIEHISQKNHWRFYEYNEENSGGIGNNGISIEYEYRKPYQYTISFDIIVNEDSLKAWKKWYDNDLKEKSDQVADQYKQTNNNSVQHYVDSANYYGNLLNKYMTDHASEYQNAIVSGDVKAQKKYEDAIKIYQNKINHFTNQGNETQQKNFSKAEGSNNDLQSHKTKTTLKFRNASVLRVTFIFNDNMAPPFNEDIKKIKVLNVFNATHAALFHNNNPDETQLVSSFLTNPNFVFALYGKWIIKNNDYTADYFLHKEATDNSTIKKIACDKIQTIFLGIEGSVKSINRFLENDELSKLTSLINN